MSGYVPRQHLAGGVRVLAEQPCQLGAVDRVVERAAHAWICERPCPRVDTHEDQLVGGVDLHLAGEAGLYLAEPIWRRSVEREVSPPTFDVSNRRFGAGPKPPYDPVGVAIGLRGM